MRMRGAARALGFAARASGADPLDSVLERSLLIESASERRGDAGTPSPGSSRRRAAHTNNAPAHSAMMISNS
jgi:hypothetical protein